MLLSDNPRSMFHAALESTHLSPPLNPSWQNYSSSSRSGYVYQSRNEQLRPLASLKSPKGFSVPSSLGEAEG
jgi:hypothetical protein